MAKMSKAKTTAKKKAATATQVKKILNAANLRLPHGYELVKRKRK